VAAVDGVGHLLKCAANFEKTMHDAEMKAADKVAYQVKLAWLGNMSGHGLTPAQKVKRRKWNVRDKTWTNNRGSVAAVVWFVGALHLIFMPTKRHIIGAKLLGTRNSIRSKQTRIGVNAAFGGSNRGVFGKKLIEVNFNQYGSVRQQAMKGTLRTREGAHALTIGANLRAYAFHPGTPGERAIWEEQKAIARQIAPNGFAPARQEALIAAGFGQAAGLGKAVAK
jgi:hypothetical protein